MLAQLICLDRRYQRMNCFNVRELQALLKEKYYSDLISDYDFRTNIFNALNLRFKLNSLAVIDTNMQLFINNNVTITSFLKSQPFSLYNNNYSSSTPFSNFTYLTLNHI